MAALAAHVGHDSHHVKRLNPQTANQVNILLLYGWNACGQNSVSAVCALEALLI